MRELRLLLVKKGEMEGTIAALKVNLDSIPFRMGKELLSDEEKLAAARFLYWNTDISSSHIAHGLLQMNAVGNAATKFLQRIGSFTSDILCTRCAKPLVFRNRLNLRGVQGHDRQHEGKNVFHPDGGGREPVCESCYEIAWQEQVQQRLAKRAA